jgi:hypothetical protein
LSAELIAQTALIAEAIALTVQHLLIQQTQLMLLVYRAAMRTEPSARLIARTVLYFVNLIAQTVLIAGTIVQETVLLLKLQGIF